MIGNEFIVNLHGHLFNLLELFLVSAPYIIVSKIIGFCSSLFHVNVEGELWTRAGHIKVNLNKNMVIGKFHN